MEIAIVYEDQEIRPTCNFCLRPDDSAFIICDLTFLQHICRNAVLYDSYEGSQNSR